MKILTVAGTRPELIRLSIIIKKLDKLVDHKIVYTNQNFDYNLSGIFFDELKIRKPDYYFENKGYSVAQFLSNAFIEFEKVLIKEKPDKILMLGDTNSGLLSLIANKHDVSIYHMEAGNRCYDKAVPEETNRRLIDHLATVNLPYTENSKQILLSEGFHRNNIVKTGNPIYEVLLKYKSNIGRVNYFNKYNVSWPKQYVLVSIHRKENVDSYDVLDRIIAAINDISVDKKVVFPVHPRTSEKIKNFGFEFSHNVVITEPIGFFDFVALERDAFVTMIDSGTALEESCILMTPSICVRNSTERPEVFECGASILSGNSYRGIVDAYDFYCKQNRSDLKWLVPQDYIMENVSDIVINTLIGK